MECHHFPSLPRAAVKSSSFRKRPTPGLCPLHISRSDAPIVPRCYAVGSGQREWSPDTESAVGASSGGQWLFRGMFQICRVFENVSLATRSGFHFHVQL